MTELHWPRLLPGEVFSDEGHVARGGSGFNSGDGLGAGSVGSMFGDGYGDGPDGTPLGRGFGCGYGTHGGNGKGGLR